MASRRERRNKRHQEVALEPTVERVDDEKEITNFDSDVVSEVPANENVVAMHDSEDEEEDEDQDQDQNEEHRTTFASVNDLHKGCYVMMKGGFPCKVVEVARSKQGKHGSAKVSITALDIFTGRKYEDLYPSSKNVEVPEVMKIELEVQAIENNRLVVKQLKDGKPHVPVALPDDEMGEKIKSLMTAQANIVVQLQCAMGKEKIVMAREKRVK